MINKLMQNVANCVLPCCCCPFATCCVYDQLASTQRPSHDCAQSPLKSAQKQQVSRRGRTRGRGPNFGVSTRVPPERVEIFRILDSYKSRSPWLPISLAFQSQSGAVSSSNG